MVRGKIPFDPDIKGSGIKGTKMKYCRKCGSPLSENAKFCLKCGTPVDAGSSYSAEETPADPVGNSTANAGLRGAEAAGQGSMASGKGEQSTSEAAAYPGLMEYLGSYIRKSLEVLKNPKQLIPTLVLGAVWMVLSIAGSFFRSLPLPLSVLSFLTYAQGGMYGGLLAAAGGIMGKVVIAAFLNAMIVPVFSGQKPFAGVAGGISGLFKGAAAKGAKEVSPLIKGVGAALILYGFMNSRQSLQEAMVGIVGVIMLLKNIGTKGGFMTGLLFSAAQTFSRGKIPSRITVDRSLSGLTIGFALAVGLSALPFRPCVWVGLVLLVIGIIFGFFGKDGSDPASGKGPSGRSGGKSAFSQKKNKNRTGNGALKAVILLLPAGIAAASGTFSPVTAYAAEALDWESYANSEEYDVRVSYGSSRKEEYEAYKDVHDETMGAGVYVYHAYDKETGREVVSQELWYKMEDAEMMKIIPFDTAFPDIRVDVLQGTNDWGEMTNDIRRGEGRSSCVFYDPYPLKDGGYSQSESTVNGCRWNLLYDGGIGSTWNLLEGSGEEEIISQAEQGLLERIPDDYYDPENGSKHAQYDIHSDIYGLTDGRVIGRYASKTDDYLATYPNQDTHEELFRAEYLIYRKLPDVPYLLFECFVTYYGDLSRYKTHTSRLKERPEADEIMDTFHKLRGQIEEMCVRDVSTTPIQHEWQEPVWTEAAVETTAAGSPVEESYENPWDTYDIPLPGETSGESASETGGSEPSAGAEPDAYQTDWDEDYHAEWDHHAGTFESIWRSFIDWLAALLFGGGVGGIIGGGLGGGAGGALGGIGGVTPGGPSGKDGGPEDEGAEDSGRRPWSYEDPSSVPKGWRIDKEGTITYRDPATGEKMKYELTGYDDETGEPQYISQNGLPYTESMIRDNYEYRERNAGTIGQDEATGKQWAKEQQIQNRNKWEQERASGKTEVSEEWKKEKAALQREEYLDDLAWKHGKQKDDLKGIKKDILEKRQDEAKEYARQMAKDDYYGAAEKTAEQVEQASDIAIDVLGEVTGPVGKNIKNAYNFAKPGLKNVAEARANGKDIYDQMEAMAYGSVEGAVNVLQNEVDSFGMKVGGDVFKAGMDAARKGEDIGAAMEAATFKSVREATIEKGFQFLGKTASDVATAGKTEKVGKLIDSAGEGGFSFKNLAGNTAKSEAVMKKAKQASDMIKQIQNTEKVMKVTETLGKDIYLAANDDNLTARAEAMQARAQAARTDIEYGKQLYRKAQMENQKKK